MLPLRAGKARQNSARVRSLKSGNWRTFSLAHAHVRRNCSTNGPVAAAVTFDASSRTCRKQIVVVGGGIGGLIVAGHLAKDGHQVTLLEQNDQLGGRCQSVVTDVPGCGGFRFDTGPSLLLFPQVYKSTFEALGSRLEEHVVVRRVQPAAYRVFFAGGARDSGAVAGGGRRSAGCSLDLLYDVQQMVEQLESLEAGAGTQYVAWLGAARTALTLGVDNFIARDADSLSQLLDLRRLLPLLGQLDVAELLGQHQDRLARRFKDARIRALLSFQDLYVGLSPYSAPGVFSLLAATEVTDGVWYPCGGFGGVVRGLAAVAAAAGVQLRTGARVEAVEVAAGAVVAVRLESGELLAADAVVMNRDVPAAYPLLQEQQQQQQLRGAQPFPYAAAKAAQLSQKEFSAGVISFNWCIGKRLERLLHHNVFMSDEYKASWQRARAPAELRQRPNFYVHVPSRTDPSAAPPSCDSVMVLLPVANIQERGGDADYSDLVAAGRRAVLTSLSAAGVGDVEEHILHEDVIPPDEWQRRYGLQHGAAFGLSHGLNQLAVLRPPLKDPTVTGLYFVGASSRPGNGVPLVMLGAGLAAQRIQADVVAGALG